MDLQDRVTFALRIEINFNDVEAALFLFRLSLGKVAFGGLNDVLLLFKINCCGRLCIDCFGAWI